MADSVKTEGFKKGEAVPQTFRDWFLNDRDHLNEWREDSRESYDFVAGRQYSDDEMKALKRKKRPVVVFNRIQPVVDSIHGNEIGNRRETRYIPREMGDVKPNELLTGASDWFRDQSHAETHESDAFWDLIVCGVGCTETRIDYEDGREGKPEIKRVDPMEMFWDYDAKERNLADCRRVWRVRRVPLAEAMEMFPGRTETELDADWANALSGDEDSGPIRSANDKKSDGLVTLVQCQWIEREAYYVAEDPMTMQQAEFTTAEYATANKRLKAMAGMEMEGVRLRRKVRKQAFFGSVVLSTGPAPCPYQFSFQFMTGKRDRNKNTWYGIVRAMKDPQRWANKWLSQMMHIMNSNSKGGLLAEKGAFENQQQAEESWGDPSAITWMNDGAIMNGSVKEKAPAQFPVGFQHLTEFAISSIRDTSGVSVEMLGLREAGQAASLEAQRTQAGMTILQPFFDAMKYYRELQGLVMLHYIQNDLSDGRLIKIVGQEGAQYVPLMRQAAEQYDIIVDDAPTSPNQKEAAWAVMMQLLPAFAKLIPPQMLITMLEYSPLPSSITEKLKQQAEQMQQQQGQQAEQMQQMAMEGQGAEIEKTKSESAKNMSDIQVDQAKIQLETASIALDALKGLASEQGQNTRANG